MVPLPTTDITRETPPGSGEHERHLAIGTIAQQVASLVGLLTMLVAITVLARRLSLAEFGTYGLMVSMTAYVMFVQWSVSAAAVKAIAEATDQSSRDGAFSTALVLYGAAGLVGGVLLATVGSALLSLLNIPADLRHQAHLSVLALGGLTVVGWPAKVFEDVLRGSQRFVSAALAEGVAYVAVGGLLTGLAVSGAPLWTLVATGSSLPLVTGLACLAMVRLKSLPYRFSRARLSVTSFASLLRFSGYLFLIGVSDLVIYSLDRAILSAFRSPSAVGLYEGPVRAHNLVRQITGTLSVTVLPASAHYIAEGDAARMRELLVRGTRYTLAVVVPLVIVLCLLSKQILEVWLGQDFGVAATAMVILVGYWLLNANTGVAVPMLLAAGRVRALTVYTTGVALLNLTLSLALTRSFGLDGVVLGTAIAYVAGFPFFLYLTLSTFRVSLRDLAREAWLPAYLTGAGLTVALLAVRLLVPLESMAAVLITSLVALFAYWIVFYVVWLRPSERALARDVVLSLRLR